MLQYNNHAQVVDAMVQAICGACLFIQKKDQTI